MKIAAAVGALFCASAVQADTFAEVVPMVGSPTGWQAVISIIGPLSADQCQQDLANFARGSLAEMPTIPGTASAMQYKGCLQADDIEHVALQLTPALCHFIAESTIFGDVRMRRYFCQYPP